MSTASAAGCRERSPECRRASTAEQRRELAASAPARTRAAARAQPPRRRVAAQPVCVRLCGKGGRTTPRFRGDQARTASRARRRGRRRSQACPASKAVATARGGVRSARSSACGTKRAGGAASQNDPLAARSERRVRAPCRHPAYAATPASRAGPCVPLGTSPRRRCAGHAALHPTTLQWHPQIQRSRAPRPGRTQAAGPPQPLQPRGRAAGLPWRPNA